jgi:hypothetical protein
MICEAHNKGQNTVPIRSYAHKRPLDQLLNSNTATGVEQEKW